MSKTAVRSILAGLILASIGISMSCVGVTGVATDPGGSGNGGGTPPGGGTGNPPPPPSIQFSGVLSWKGDNSRSGLYSNETTLTPTNVNVNQFGKVSSFQGDGIPIAQPLYISNVDMGTAGTHNVIIIATEHDSVYALDADNLSAGPLWERHYLDAANGVTTLPDNFGGRTTLGGEVGITGTPVVDPTTGALYFVTVLAHNGVAEQWLRAVDIRTGNNFGPGSVKVQTSVPGDGVGSANGQIAFDPSLQDQRAGLALLNGSVLVPWGSFSDWGVYHGWLMAFDTATLSLQAVFNPTPQFQANDVVSGPADHGGGAAFWQGGAAPAIDADGNIYLNSADGSFNADQGGNNYGDTMLKLRLNGNSFQIVDSFTPFNQACIDASDLEIGSGGVALLPTSATGGTKMAMAVSKEGRFFLVNTDTMGQYNAAGDDQIVQEFMIGEHSCTSGTAGAAEGTGWNRMYGNVSFWNNNMYGQASSLALKQYQFQNGTFNPNPVAQSPTVSGLRGGNTVISANGNQNGIVWAYEKSSSSGILHAYDGAMVSNELWNSNMNAGRDHLGTGIGFMAPVVANGKVIVTYDFSVAVYGQLQ